MDYNVAIDKRMLVELALMYYVDGATQQEIADKFFISRSLVSKYLGKAREEGVVEIVVHEEDIQQFRELEKRLEKKFLLQRVICVNTVENKMNQKRRLGAAAAKYLTLVAKPKQSIGISAGSTILEMAKAVSPYSKLNSNLFIPLSGGLSTDHKEIHAHVICEIIAKKTTSKNLELFSPLIVDSKKSKKVFYKQPFIIDVINQAKEVDIAFIGAGPSPMNNHITSFYIEDTMTGIEKIERLTNLVGDISYIFVDKDGNQIDCEWNDRLIGLEMTDLHKIKHVVLVAGGEDKYDTILAGCRSGSIEVLITDVNVARKLLES